MDPLQLAPRDLQIARPLRATAQQNGVEPVAQLVHCDVHADVGVRDEAHALRLHLAYPPVDEALLHFKVRYAVAQQSADPVVLLEHRDVMARAAELLRRGQSRRSGADHRDPLAGSKRRRLGQNPALLECPVDHGLFDLLDRDRRLVNAEHAGSLARRRADAPRELREVVGRVQDPHRLLPASAEDQIVPVGNDVVHRTPGVAERHAAIHAARALIPDAVFRKRLVDFEPVIDSIRNGAPLWQLPCVLHEPGHLTHEPPASGRTAR